MDFETLGIWHWILLVLVGIVGLIIGFILGKGGKPAADTSLVQTLETKNNALQAELTACREEATSLSQQFPEFRPEFNPVEAKSLFGKRIKENDLKLIEGIGPKIEGLFHNFDIKTWKALSEASVERCQQVLASGGDRYKIHDPASWPMQAKMAYEGEWKSLHRWQVEHKHGKL